MKKCPYCAEEIQDEAIKCKHCGEMLKKDQKPKKTKLVNICPRCSKIYDNTWKVCINCSVPLEHKEIETKGNGIITATDKKSTAKPPSSDLGLIITLGVILLLICFAVIRATNSGQSTTNSSKTYRSTDRGKTPSLVDWGPLGDSDEEAEKTLNAFFNN